MANLISQELFDETILENEECFDLSPEDALRETIDQFAQQLGVANKNNTNANDANNNDIHKLDLFLPWYFWFFWQYFLSYTFNQSWNNTLKN